jgi:cellulose synthase/poly-beta-1,6-N-acetylglucosamine synthase-like glycosyltransferase
MEKKTWIIISIILTIISLLYIFLSYFGMVRCLTLQMQSPESFAKDYHELEMASDKYRIVISLAVNKVDVKNMKSVLTSLLDQTVKVSEISINVPPDAEKLVPKYMYDYANVYILGKDYGPSNVIIPTIIREKDKDCIVIMLDNDVIYGQNYIADMVDNYLKRMESYPDGLVIYDNIDKDGVMESPMIMKTGVFHSNIVNIVEQGDDNMYQDSDVWISAHILESVKKVKFNYMENFRIYTSARRMIVDRKNKKKKAIEQMKKLKLK